MVRKYLSNIGIDLRKLYHRIAYWSIMEAQKQQSLTELVNNLRALVPDISQQYSRNTLDFNRYYELKMRAQQAFQCSVMLKAIEDFSAEKLVVADIGDSAGTHMIYLKELTKGKFDLETVSVNLDPRAVRKIQDRGLNAIQKRAEDIRPEDIDGKQVDLFTSFQMVEHLHNPAIFFRNIAKKSLSERMLITVPYLKQSRVGLHHIKNRIKELIYAEDEHIFELSPEDWTHLLLHSGWKVAYSKTYYQYPRRWPVVSSFLRWIWKKSDYEGFWGAILEKDTTYSDFYQDWEE